MTHDQLRELVCTENLRLWHSGLTTLTWGNVSGVTSDRSIMMIKPSGIAYEKLRPEDIVAVDLDGHVVQGDLRPSSDTPTHLEIYRAFPAVTGVAHTHSRYATAFAQARHEIPCLGTTHADHFCGPVPVTRVLRADEVAEGYEHYTGRSIADCFDRLDPVAIPGVLVAGHGPFTWGPDPATAVDNAVALEAIAAMAMDTLALDGNTPTLARWVLDKHHERKHGAKAYYGQPVVTD